ncbi:unnamed protein product [Arctogadus glacialis]
MRRKWTGSYPSKMRACQGLETVHGQRERALGAALVHQVLSSHQERVPPLSWSTAHSRVQPSLLTDATVTPGSRTASGDRRPQADKAGLKPES